MLRDRTRWKQNPVTGHKAITEAGGAGTYSRSGDEAGGLSEEASLSQDLHEQITTTQGKRKQPGPGMEMSLGFRGPTAGDDQARGEGSGGRGAGCGGRQQATLGDGAHATLRVNDGATSSRDNDTIRFMYEKSQDHKTSSEQCFPLSYISLFKSSLFRLG